MSTLITYKIVSDLDGRLKAAARTACNLWNRFVAPGESIVIRVGTFTAFDNTIARAYKPYRKAEVTYGVIEFNTKYLETFSANDIAGTLAHELGHTLGYGWDKWLGLFDQSTGRFHAPYVAQLPALGNMHVETDYGDGTTLSHWDEEAFDAELMTGFKDKAEYVLPITFDITTLLGHTQIERLKKKTSLGPLLEQMAAIQFQQKDLAKSLDLDYFVQTPLVEETYAPQRRARPARVTP